MTCTLRKLLAIAILTLAAALSTGCSGTDVAAAPTAPAAVLPCAPVEVSAGLDQTGSANRNRTPRPTAPDFRPLYDLMTKCGGELATGVFGSRDNGPLLRLRFPQPPAMPTPPDENQNPYSYSDRRAEYEARRTTAEAAGHARAEEIRRNIAAYEAALAELLSRPANAYCSDIAAGLRRLARFHNEPASGWTPEPRKYLLAVTDGEHNCGPAILDPLPGVEVFAINGAPGLGILRALHPRAFENFAAALRAIVTESTSNQKEEK